MIIAVYAQILPYLACDFITSSDMDLIIGEDAARLLKLDLQE